MVRLLLRERRAIRNSELWMIVLAALIAVPVGMLVAGLHNLVGLMHQILFDLPTGTRLSAEVHASSMLLVIVPVLGGLALGFARHYFGRERGADIVDPIEANALRGGDMSLKDSLRLLLSTLTSNGSGASVGMEAGYTQSGAALFSVVARFFRLRREDRRIFVTAGAAAAISAAFDAPLAGAFYGFELVLGTYNARSLAPVGLAAVVGALIARLFGAEPLIGHLAPEALRLASWIYPGGLILGIGAAFVGIFTMKAASVIENALRRTEGPVWFAPAFAGIMLGIVAMGTPQVLGSGQGAIQYHFANQWATVPLIILLVAKIGASAISLGSGFRGGLFSSSLLIGCLYGAAVAGVVESIAPGLAVQDQVMRLIGMAAVGASIIGAPLTMGFLVLETTGDLGVTIAVLSAVLAAAAITRIRFGYSFATWRFHLRGLALHGAYDVGWIQELTVGRLMRTDPRLVTADQCLADLRRDIPPGSALRVFAIDAVGHYLGAIDVELLHDPSIADAASAIVAADLATDVDNVLTPHEDIQAALKKFNNLRVEILPVIASAQNRQVVGYLTEALTLKRYTDELEQRRSADLGLPSRAG